MSVTLVRHTRPDVDSGICYGQTDLDVAASFPDDMRRVLTRMDPFDVLVTSPLRRCRRLAEAIGANFDVEPRIDGRIQEMDFGAWEGRAWSDIPAAELDEWAADFLHARPHGGESVAMLRARALEALHDFRRSGKKHVVVTHAGVIRAALARDDTPAGFAASVDYGGSVSFGFKQDQADD